MKETSRFYSSLGLLIVLNAIIKPFWIFGIDRSVQNAVGTVAYGTYFSLFNLSVVFSFLLDWGLTAFFNRQLASKKENFSEQAGNFLLIKLVFSGLYAAVIAGVAIFTHIERWDILWSVIFIQVFTSMFLFFRSVITARQWFRTDAFLSVLDKTLMILICGSFLYFPAMFGKINISKFLSAQMICTALAMITAFIILLKRGIIFLSFHISAWNKNLFSSALPFAIIVLLMSVHYRLDGFLLERIHPYGAHEAGVYAAAYRLLDAANMIGVLLSSFLLPYVARQWSEQKNITDVVLNNRHFLIMFSITIASVCFFLAQWIQNVLYHHRSEDAVTVLQWCLPALIGYSLVQIYGTIITATGHIVSFCYIVLGAVLINIILNLLLIPTLGAKGSCYAALASQWSCGIATLIYTKRKLGVNIDFRSVIIYIFTAGLLAGFFYVSKNWNISRLFLIGGAGIITLFVMFATGLLGIRKWISSLRKTQL